MSKQQITEKKAKMTIFDIVISVISLVVSTSFFIYNLCVANDQGVMGYADWTTYVAYVAGILTLFNWIFTIKKMVINCYFGIAWAILNGAIAIYAGFLGNILRFIAINLPLQIVGLIIWYKASKNKKTVETRKSKPALFWPVIAGTLVIAGLFTYFETQPWFQEPLGMQALPWYEALADAIGFAFSIATAIFIIGRYNEYWIATSVASLSGFVLWLAHSIINPTEVSNWQMLISAIINLVFCIKGIIEWYGLKKPKETKNV